MVQYHTVGSEPGAPGAAHNYGLAPLPQLPCPEMRGPTPWSNWVLRGRLLAGAYPASLDDAETERILTTLLELGMNTFVCLQAEFSLHTPEAAWRAGQGLRPYIKDAQQLLIRARETRSRRILQDKLDFLHLPIIDGSVTSDSAMSRLADDCCTRILRGERLYVHCWGGHGRTGTLIAVMLGRLYGITCSAALRFTQAFHDRRKFPQGVRSPQTTPQVAQVKRLLPDPPSMRGVVYPRDPSIVLDDVIVRPSSASTAAPAVPLQPCSASSRAGTSPAPPTSLSARAGGGSSVAASAAAGPLPGGDIDDMEIDEVSLLPTVPVNQQRKEAIRAAKQQVGAGNGTAAIGGPAVAGAAASLAAALQAAGLQPHTAAVAAAAAAPAAIPAPLSPAERQRDWLSSVFGKSLSRGAQRGEAPPASSIAAAHAAALSHRQQQQQDQERQASYLQRYVQHQQQHQSQHHQEHKDGGIAGKGGNKGGVICLTASSGATASIIGTPYDPADGGGDAQLVDMRPSKLTVAVPDAAVPERSDTSVQRMRNYLTGYRAPTTK